MSAQHIYLLNKDEHTLANIGTGTWMLKYSHAFYSLHVHIHVQAEVYLSTKPRLAK